MSISPYCNLYESLKDELSKTLFLDRLLFSITKEWKYIYKLVEDSNPELYDNINRIDNTRELIIYGAGVNCDTVVYACRKMGRAISFVCDRDETLHGKLYQGIPIISPAELIDFHQNAYILVSTTRYLDEVLDFLRQHFDEQQIIPFANEHVMERIRMQYFDSCIDLKDGEVFVDGGSYDFETSEILMSLCNPQKILAFEPDDDNYQVIIKSVEEKDYYDIEVFQKGLWNENRTLNFIDSIKDCCRVDGSGGTQIEVVALDQIIDDKVTLIKMDIEGSELKALQGAQKLIRKYRPRLAICIYHKLEDVIEILEYIKSLVPEYQLFIRHHSINQCETVVYAIYKNE